MTQHSIFDIYPLFLDENQTISYFFEIGIFYRTRDCPICESSMELMTTRDSWRCEKRICRKQISIRANTFFAKTRLPCSKILALGYFWLFRSKATALCEMTGIGSEAVCAYIVYFRRLVAGHLEEVDCIIGGEGIVVEIDESKLGKRKHHRGHPVEGVWVIGGIEKTAEKKMFIISVEDRKAETLIEIIKKHVIPGSIIRTDMWKGYCQLEKHGYIHQTVNHSKYFKDPVTGVHTNTIEGAWNGLKLTLTPQQRTKKDMENRLGEYLWRRQNKKNLWDALIKALIDTHFED